MLNEHRYTAGMIAGVLVLGLVGTVVTVGLRGCEQTREASVPFTYAEPIGRVAPGRWVDRRLDLRRCVAGWEHWSGARSKLFAAMAKMGVQGRREVVLLEQGHSTWAMYGYALAVDGVIQQGLEGNQPLSRPDLGNVRTPAAGNLPDSIEDNVDDGGCWFATVWHDGKLTQAVMYGGFKPSGPVAELVERMGPSAHQPPSD
jgi:hypothetical protein